MWQAIGSVCSLVLVLFEAWQSSVRDRKRRQFKDEIKRLQEGHDAAFAAGDMRLVGVYLAQLERLREDSGAAEDRPSS